MVAHAVKSREELRPLSTRAKVYALLDAAWDLGSWVSLWVRDEDLGEYVAEWCSLHAAERPVSVEYGPLADAGKWGRTMSLRRGDRGAIFVDVYYPTETSTETKS